jgi:hypothetical protein
MELSDRRGIYRASDTDNSIGIEMRDIKGLVLGYSIDQKVLLMTLFKLMILMMVVLRSMTGVTGC